MYSFQSLKKGFKMAFILVMVYHTGCKPKQSLPDYYKERHTFFKNYSTTNYHDSIIRCVSYNIQLGFRLNQDPWTASDIGATPAYLEELTTFLKSFQADIIALQEVPQNRYNTEIKSFIEALAVNMHMNVAFGTHGYNDPTGIYPVQGEWGLAILTKYRIDSIQQTEIAHLSVWEKRSNLMAFLHLNDSQQVHVTTLHYIANNSIYEDQILQTKRGIVGKNPMILLGDFNADMDKQFNDMGLENPDTLNVLGIDEILYSKDYFSSAHMKSVQDSLNFTSDHALSYIELQRK